MTRIVLECCPICNSKLCGQQVIDRELEGIRLWIDPDIISLLGVEEGSGKEIHRSKNYEWIECKNGHGWDEISFHVLSECLKHQHLKNGNETGE